LTRGKHRDVCAIPELLAEGPRTAGAAAAVLASDPRGHAAIHPLRNTPAKLGHMLEVGDVAAIIQAGVPCGIIPLQRAVLAREALGDLVPH